MRVSGPGARALIPLAACLVLCVSPAAVAQSAPGPALLRLETEGHEKVADRLADLLAPNAAPDRGDVENALRLWRREAGGPGDGWQWLAVARLWLRAGDAGRAREALERAAAGSVVPPGHLLLDRARVDFLDGRPERASEEWWRACEVADESSALETWRDLEPLATPDEAREWDRLRRLPAGQRDDCAFFRRFWNRRAAASTRTVDDRLRLHYARMRTALRDYRRRGRERGRFSEWAGRPGTSPPFDDRGLLYVRMGPPDLEASFGGDDCFEPNVTWAWEYPDGRRLYHLSPLGGTDDWWLIENLGEVFRCPVDPATGRILRDRSPAVALPPSLPRIPAWILQELYLSRASVDLAYARLASRLGELRTAEELAREREWTRRDARLALETVPERPTGDLSLDAAAEWLQFRSVHASRTSVWLNARVVDSRDRIGDAPLEAAWTLLSLDGTILERATARAEAGRTTDGRDDGEDGSPRSWAVRLRTEVPPGDYLSTASVREAGRDDERPAGTWWRDTVSVRSLGGTAPQLSDIAVSPDTGGVWRPGHGVALSPAPDGATGPDRVAWLYLEAYNLTPATEYAATVRLEPEEGDTPPFELRFTGEAPAGGRVVTPILLRLDLAATAPGRYRAAITVRDGGTGAATLPARTRVTVSRPGGPAPSD